MNIDKSEVKIALSKELGAHYASMVRAAAHDALRQEGARDALKLAAQRVGELGAHVDKDLEEGVLSAEDLRDPQRVEAYIKRFIRRMWGVIDNLATTAEVTRLNAIGRQKGLESAEEVVRVMCTSEQAKLSALQKQIESGDLQVEGGRLLDGHPGLSLKHQREDEAAAQRAVEVAPEVSSESVQEPKKAPTRPRKKQVPKTKG